MEIEGEDGTKLSLNPGVKAVFGRGSGFNTEDLTVSRRHVSLELKPSAAGTQKSDRVSFEVLGRNPVWVRAGESGEKIETFRKSETGEIAAGERFCVSGHFPVWFNLKRRDEVTEERFSNGESGLASIDFSNIDPVQEFGFLVIGKEFDQYAKSRIRDIKQWEWFLEDSGNGNSDDDEDRDKKGRKGLVKKRRRKKGNEDDDWSVESEEDKELMVKSKRVTRPTYSTRSKKTKKDINATTSSSRAQTKPRGKVDVEEEEEDDDDETMGGFIVSDEEAELEEEDEPNTDEEEEEDIDEDEDDDDE